MMKRADLNRIQIRILLLVREEGRTATESLYDLVEEARPTVDEDGEQLYDDVDIYETSREEIGALENGGLLAQDDEGMACGGYSSLTKKGAKIADKLADDFVEPEDILVQLQQILWPEGDPDHEWDSDTLGYIGELMHQHGFAPAGE